MATTPGVGPISFANSVTNVARSSTTAAQKLQSSTGTTENEPAKANATTEVGAFSIANSVTDAARSSTTAAQKLQSSTGTTENEPAKANATTDKVLKQAADVEFLPISGGAKASKRTINVSGAKISNGEDGLNVSISTKALKVILSVLEKAAQKLRSVFK